MCVLFSNYVMLCAYIALSKCKALETPESRCIAEPKGGLIKLN